MPTAALESYLAGMGGKSSSTQSTLAASIDAHLATLSSTRNICRANFSSMQAILDGLQEVRVDVMLSFL